MGTTLAIRLGIDGSIQLVFQRKGKEPSERLTVNAKKPILQLLGQILYQFLVVIAPVMQQSKARLTACARSLRLVEGIG